MGKHSEFYGCLVRTFSGPQFLLAERFYEANTSIPLHRHDTPYFCFIVSGGLSERVGEHVWECTVFDGISNFVGEAHADHFTCPSRTFSVEVCASMLKGCRPGCQRTSPRLIRGGRLAWRGLSLYTEFVRGHGDVQDGVESLVWELLAEPLATDATPPGWLRRVRNAIDGSFREPFALESLAQLGGVHVVHLARTFHRYYGSTVGSYVRRLRIDFACRELVRSARPVSAIAQDAGFHDQSHFTRTFRSALRFTPAQFRRIHQRS